MKRIKINPRPNWRNKVESAGLVFHQLSNGEDYWKENAYYRFNARQIDELETATYALQKLFLETAQHIIDNNRFAELGIPESAVPIIKWAWEKEPPAIYGRFDLAYDGINPPKLLEYNADTPTALLEASVVQWFWLQDVFPKADQFNSIHEKLVAKWHELHQYLTGATLYFAHMKDDSLEDTMTVTYLRDTAQEGGISRTAPILISDIGWDAQRSCFVDIENQPIRSIFKLYPWEWLVNEEFGEFLLRTYQENQWIEPIWKMLLSNKGTLPILWELFPKHPNLLPAFFNEPGSMTSFVKKPKLSREGANVEVVINGNVILQSDGDYGEEGFIYQEYYPLPNFDGHKPVLGSWMIDQESAGIGVRESKELVTDNLSSFVPHMFE